MTERPSALQQPSYTATTGHNNDAERGVPGGKAGPYIRIADHLNVGGKPTTSNSTPTGVGHSRDSSFLHEATHYDYRKGPEQFRVAQGDIPDNTVTRFYHYLVGVSMVTRWALFILPVLGLLWIPGILGLTAFPNGHIWWTPLLWWSIWFSVWWAGYWAALLVSMLLPKVLRYTIGVVAIGTRRYIEWLSAIHRYVAIFAWALVSFVSFIPLITKRQAGDRPDDAAKALDICTRILLGILICSAILLGLKLLIQIIATNFHERSYAERLEAQRHNTRTLVTLYINSTDHPERADTLHDGPQGATTGKMDPTRFFKNFIKGAKGVAQSTTQAFGNIATEIVGTSVLQPNSPQAIVAQALTSPNKTRLLARRLYYSFRKMGAEVVKLGDIEEYFNGHDEAVSAFAMFDRDGNGDATREEMELACMDLHREKLALASSMRDIDSAVGRLDNILMTIYVAVAAIVFAVTLDAAVSTLLTGAAGFLLALSWLIGASMQEVLASIIFLFVKVMYDVGDRVDIDGTTFTVKEIRLLSTVFIDTRGCQVQAPNVVLNGKFIYNHRRSQQMSEPYTYDVAWDVTFEQLEALRARMLAFVKEERRDYLPVFDVVVDNFTDQSKLSLKSDIKYKSNWQQGALKVQRRNKWICALKVALKETKIWGPAGDPAAVADPVEYTQIPWDEVRAKKEKAAHPERQTREPLIPRSNYQLLDKNQTVLDQSQDVFGEGKELAMTGPKQTAGMRQRAAYGYGGGVASSGPTGGRPTAEAAFQGPGGAQTAAAGGAAAAAAGGMVIISQADDDNDGDGN
ncbi:hypothetical protein M408DRAFT_66234 [Serendipita vermifera MAFF 305830]|uniref:EF-hand domain-containing protein n=1 Tax=Serendipita vermifera MAFF 305830 TaxID=933852 RepID=A0A0C3BE68_SERVB|nr:hypothetical protein M408DRAFT_66234 [Serendipita vermifera MAFF 305830]